MGSVGKAAWKSEGERIIVLHRSSQAAGCFTGYIQKMPMSAGSEGGIWGQKLPGTHLVALTSLYQLKINLDIADSKFLKDNRQKTSYCLGHVTVVGHGSFFVAMIKVSLISEGRLPI